jgi:hypothetical protein
MKHPRRPAPPRTSSGRGLTVSASSSLAGTPPSTATKASASRIADKMQILALSRPNMLHLVETLVDGMLSERRGDDDHPRLDD